MDVTVATGPRANAPAAGGYRSDIDGLRAIAVLSVLFYHAHFQFFGGGFTGVDIFFVISGFLIGGHIHAEQLAGTFRFAGFYQRRAKRILPALFAVLIFALVVGSVLLSPFELRAVAIQSASTLLSASNVYFWHRGSYFVGLTERSPLLMTWSLGVEEQFYIVVPLLMVWLLRFSLPLRRILAALAVLSFALACYQVAHLPDNAFYLLPGRAWELLSGVLLAILPVPTLRLSGTLHQILGAVGLLLVLGSIFILNSATPFPGLAASPAVLGTTLLLASERSWVNTSFLSLPPLRFVGRISYSLYLWHWPLLSFAAIVLGHRAGPRAATALLAVAFLLAVASFYAVEQTFRRSSRKPRPLLLRYAAASAVLFAVSSTIFFTYGLRSRFPELAAEEKLEADTGDPCLVFDPVAHPNLSSQCFDNSGKPTVVLWGDSHAATLGEVIRLKAHSQGYGFTEIAKAACPPLLDTGRYFPAIPGHDTQCIAFNNLVLKSLTLDPKIKVVILAANWKGSFVEPYTLQTGWIATAGSDNRILPTLQQSEATFTTSLKQTVTTLEGAGKQVILLQDTPSFAVEPIWNWRTARIPLRRWLVLHLHPTMPVDPGSHMVEALDRDRDVRNLIAAAAAPEHAQVFDLEQALCASPGVCRYNDANHFFFRDEQHLSLEGAVTVLSNLHLPANDR